MHYSLHPFSMELGLQPYIIVKGKFKNSTGKISYALMHSSLVTYKKLVKSGRVREG